MSAPKCLFSQRAWRFIYDDLDAARQKLPREKICRSVVEGAILKEDKKPSLVGEEAIWEAF